MSTVILINIHRLSLDQPDLTAIRIDRGTRFGVHKLHLQAHKESDTAIDKEIELELPQQADHTHAHRHGEQSRNSTIISEEVERTIEIHVVKTSLPNNTHVSEMRQTNLSSTIAQTVLLHLQWSLVLSIMVTVKLGHLFITASILNPQVVYSVQFK